MIVIVIRKGRMNRGSKVCRMLMILLCMEVQHSFCVKMKVFVLIFKVG